MRLTDGIFTRTETGTSSWGSGVLKSLSLSALPALPPSRRERATRELASRIDRATLFATRVTASSVQPVLLPNVHRGKV